MHLRSTQPMRRHQLRLLQQSNSMHIDAMAVSRWSSGQGTRAGTRSWQAAVDEAQTSSRMSRTPGTPPTSCSRQAPRVCLFKTLGTLQHYLVSPVLPASHGTDWYS